ncbi:MAG: SusD/RagB family nutrient-binding outer membrane lipoprotein, partial [Bacteroidales bacterium]
MMMKKIYKYILAGALCFMVAACEDFDTLNQDPNNPVEIPSHMLMNGAQKSIMDDIYDAWFSGRQCLLYSQYWVQRNYTEEDRYQIRESENNSKFDALYRGVANLQKVVALNMDEQTKGNNARYGANCNQIAAAIILKVWLMGIITDTWGSVPYTDVGKLEEGVLYCKYDEQKTIYKTLIDELTTAVNGIDESKVAFVSGDMIYGGDASKWKKFGNSLKCRLAVHLSKVDPNWKTYISEAVASGVFTSNADAAAFNYSSSGLDFCKFYANYYVDGRNDFTISKTLTDILKGEADALNGKSHPWTDVIDPRLRMYTTSYDGAYNGIPYGAPTENMSSLRPGTPNW